MATYRAKYWTGASELLAATSLQDAYKRLGYSDGDGTHLWEETGEVTNETGDVCVTITKAQAVKR